MSISKIALFYTTDELWRDINQSDFYPEKSQSKFHQLCFQSLSIQFPTAYSFSFYFDPADNPSKLNTCSLLQSIYNSSDNTISEEWITTKSDYSYDLDIANKIVADIIAAQLWLVKRE